MPDAKLTEHEAIARQLFADLAREPVSRWSVVRGVEPGMWFDFYCPITGKYGQCRMREDLTWQQEPRGKQPVILRYHGRGKS